MSKLGADPLATNVDGSNALMAAAGLGTRSPGEDAGTEEEVLEAMQVALDLGIDINAVDKHDETAMHGAAYKNLPLAVKFLASKGARIDIWNRKNEFGWTPLTIARGYRFGNFKPSPVTIAAVEEVMLSAGIRPPTEKEEQAEGFDIYAKPRTRPAGLRHASPLRIAILTYPQTRRGQDADTYHGITVPDPYRWLEDDSSPETAAWVQAQNAATEAYLAQIPFRAELKARLQELYNYPRYLQPSTRGGVIFFYKNDGLQNQNVLLMQKGIDAVPRCSSIRTRGRATAPCVSPSSRRRAMRGTPCTRCPGVGLTGSSTACSISRRRSPLPDTIEWVKVSSAAWSGNGFYYSRYPVPPPGKALSSSNEHHRVFYHRLGTPQDADELVFEDPGGPCGSI